MTNRETAKSVLWQCLDTPGMDACRICQSDHGWLLNGCADFVFAGDIVMMRYEVVCGPDWTSQSASIAGWIGGRDFQTQVQRSTHGNWMIDGNVLPKTSELQDIDLGFTPATNTNAINRLALDSGKSSMTRALWLDVNDWSMKPLSQTYGRKSANLMTYASPDNDYHTELTVDDFGIVRTYPGLWQAVELPHR
ncbi:MAG: putative glycolipid-binding domain-containing protein [Rhizobiaceae bacterium]